MKTGVLAMLLEGRQTTKVASSERELSPQPTRRSSFPLSWHQTRFSAVLVHVSRTSAETGRRI